MLRAGSGSSGAVSGTSNSSPLVATGYPVKNKAVLVGDSQTNNQDGVSTSAVSTNLRSWFHWYQSMMGYPFKYYVGMDAPASGVKIGHNKGVGGDNLVLILARMTDILSVVDNNTTVFIECGTNDPTLYTVAQYKANLPLVAAPILAKGARIVWVCPTPRNQVDGGGSSYWASTTNRTKGFGMVAALIDYVRSAGGDQFIFDCSRILTGSNGDMVATYTSDGLHRNARGGYPMAVQALTDLNEITPPANPMHLFSSLDLYDATNNVYGNLISNGHFAGTGGTKNTGVSGNLADTWTLGRVDGTVATCVCSKVTDSTPNGLVWQRMTFDGVGGGSSGETFRLQWNGGTNITTGIVAGEWYYASMLMRFSAPSSLGNSAFQYAYYRIDDATASTGYGGQWGNSLLTGDIGMPEVDSPIFEAKTHPVQAQGTTGFDIDMFIDVDGTRATTFYVDIAMLKFARMPTAPSFT